MYTANKDEARHDMTQPSLASRACLIFYCVSVSGYLSIEAQQRRKRAHCCSTVSAASAKQHQRDHYLPTYLPTAPMVDLTLCTSISHRPIHPSIHTRIDTCSLVCTQRESEREREREGEGDGERRRGATRTTHDGCLFSKTADRDRLKHGAISIHGKRYQKRAHCFFSARK